MTRPNFFLIGAPRTGTTAMCQHLQEHASVMICEPKEPYYWAEDMPGMRKLVGCETLEAYLKLFDHAAADSTVVGEGSTFYLSSKVAVPNIMKFCPEARIMVMLRHPVELAFSLYGQLKRTLNEDSTTFDQAWDLQEERMSGRRIPATCVEPLQLQYRQIVSLGAHLERVQNLVPGNQLLIIWHEDLVADPQQTYKSVCRFLDIRYDGRDTIRRTNESSRFRSQYLASALQQGGVRRLTSVLKKHMPMGLLRLLQRSKERLVTAPVTRPELNSDFRSHIQTELEPDIKLLSRLTGRDLSDWLRPERLCETAA